MGVSGLGRRISELDIAIIVYYWFRVSTSIPEKRFNHRLRIKDQDSFPASRMIGDPAGVIVPPDSPPGELVHFLFIA
jgi:hypothetical protein